MTVRRSLRVALLCAAIAAPGASTASAASTTILTQGPAVAFPTVEGVRLVGAPERVGFADAPAAVVDRATGSRVLARIRGSRFFDAVPDGEGGAWLVGSDVDGPTLRLQRLDGRGRTIAVVDRLRGIYLGAVGIGGGRVALHLLTGLVVVDGRGRFLRSARVAAEEVLVGGGDGVIALARAGRARLVSAVAGRPLPGRVRRLPRGARVVLVTPRDVLVATARVVLRRDRRTGRVIERHVISARRSGEGVVALAEADGTLWIGGAFERVDGVASGYGLAAVRDGHVVPLRGDLRALRRSALTSLAADEAGALANGRFSDEPRYQVAASATGVVRDWAPRSIGGLDRPLPLGDRALVLNRGAIEGTTVAGEADVALPSRRIAPVGDVPRGLAATPDGRGGAWLVRREGGRLVAELVDAAGRHVRRLPPLAGAPRVLAARGDRLVVLLGPYGGRGRSALAAIDASVPRPRWRVAASCGPGHCRFPRLALDASRIALLVRDRVVVYAWPTLARRVLPPRVGEADIAFVGGRIVAESAFDPDVDLDDPPPSFVAIDPDSGRALPFGPVLTDRSGEGIDLSPSVGALRATGANLLVCGSFSHADEARRRGLVLLGADGRVLPYRQSGRHCRGIEVGHGRVVLSLDGTTFRVVPGP